MAYEDNEMTEDKLTRACREAEDCIAYQNSIRLREDIKNCIDMYEGRQWGDPERYSLTSELPRPKYNIIRKIVDSKVSTVGSSDFKYIYSTPANINGQSVTNFIETQKNTMKLAKKYKKVLKAASVTGSGIIHIIWDSEARGDIGDQKGGISAEVIDVRKFFVSNPLQEDIQKQEWVMISSRESVRALKRRAKQEFMHKDAIDKITADEREEGDSIEREESKLCTVYTKYFRIDGEVYYQKFTRTVELCSPRALNSELNMKEAKMLLGYDGEDSDMDGNSKVSIEDIENGGTPDNPETANGSRPKAPFYPVAVFNWYDRTDSIYGISEVIDLIDGQKALNRITALLILIGIAQSSSKYVIRDKCTDDEITNSPINIIHEKKNTLQGNGIYMLPPGQASGLLASMPDAIIKNMRTISGATEVLAGEVISANMSGQAIAMLQSQAKSTTETIADNFMSFHEELAKILLQTTLLNAELSTAQDVTGVAESSQVMADNNTEDIYSITVEALPSVKGNEASIIATLENLLAKDHITVTDYVRMLPDSVLPNKNEVLKILEEKENAEKQQLMSQIQILEQQIEQLTSYIESKKNILQSGDKLVKENTNIKELLIQLQDEYIEKINLANAEINKIKEAATNAVQLQQMRERAHA